MVAHLLTVEELPRITGEWESAIPDNYEKYISGYVSTSIYGHSSGSNNGIYGNYKLDFGANQKHENRMPYIAVYIFRRTV